MPVSNSDIADLFDKAASLLEIQAANAFRVRAYRNASRVIRNWPESLASIIRRGSDLPKMPGIGEDLAEKIGEAVRTRNLALLTQLKRETPEGLVALLRIPGLGPKRVLLLQKSLGVRSVQDLEAALNEGRLDEIRGFGPKLEEKIRAELRRSGPGEPSERKRLALATAEQIAEPLLFYIKECANVKQATIAGSYRRRCETVGDLDLLVSCDDQEAVMKHFLAFEDIDQVVSKGATRSTVIFKSGVQVDLRAVGEESYGAALHYFTGSKAHNIHIRSMGVKRGLKINEYGIFRGSRRVGGESETDVFKSVGLPYIEPELRENQGEIEAAAAGRLPDLVRLDQIRGDLHAHSKATDGRLSIEEMAAAARKLGYEYLSITDHSKRLTVARGLDTRRLSSQLREIDRLNEKFSDFRILKSIEVDILEDGSLDLPDSILSQLDLTVCSVHSHFDLSARKQIERILRAMDNPYFNILGHPTGRLIGQRPAMEFDLEEVMKGAKERGCALEINAQPERMDLSDVHCRLAKKIGVMVAISTDAHSDHDLQFMKFGVSLARRGWLERTQVLNTRSCSEIVRLVRRKGVSAA
ncbi:MAG: DNA polymerase/3'-5' exonuclease PolX [Oligoflexia bacterium]|nr:DNA polymerase/3'-5' exonuclease PolX [Oligoflexia bacterium]